MPNYSAPIRDFQFLLHDYLDLQKYKDVPGFADATPDLIDTLLTEGAKVCEEVLFPINQSGDAEGIHFENGKVTLPKGFKEAYKAYAEGGWIGLACDPEHGGQGLPEVVATPIVEMICSANLSFGITPGLSHGAYNALRLHATDDLKKRFMPNIASGKWSGVMGLTEPHCGTDLGLIRTIATPSPSEGEGRDGGSGNREYRITGTKIFISSGEQDLTDNIIHLVLARLPDAPKGIKGISLFLVPKILEDGKPNGVKCSGVEHKMGIHASPTCVM
ncbi:MAG: acyl-CoA dehydrogenase family protein, partial [Alphaproteobacteria bacterium]|nr:acyl-CoA dehydrogenase family protein [Alphaproteobacteria bacterium]